MEFWMRYEKHKAETVKTCENSRVRFYDVPKICFIGQLEDFDYSRVSVWPKTDEDNFDYFSAVGYYFEREIGKNLDVPVGIIGCNWGGLTASVWMMPEIVEQEGS